jgi:hypothetical protein
MAILNILRNSIENDWRTKHKFHNILKHPLVATLGVYHPIYGAEHRDVEINVNHSIAENEGILKERACHIRN